MLGSKCRAWDTHHCALAYVRTKVRLSAASGSVIAAQTSFDLFIFLSNFCELGL